MPEKEIIAPDGSKCIYTQCATPYRNKRWETPTPEDIVDVLPIRWSPYTRCNAYDADTGKCKVFERIEPIDSSKRFRQPSPRLCNRKL